MKKLLFATLVFFFTLTVVPNVSLAGSQTFLTNGTFTVPAGVTQVSVTAVGGGGGGGAGNWFTSAREKGGSAGGGGGGGGGAISSFSISVTPWSVHLITIGAGGSGGRAYYRGSPGSPGGSTSFGTLLTVLGGGGGGGADLGYPWGTRVRGGAGGAGGVGPMVGNDGANGLVDSFSYGPCGGSGGASILGGYGSGGGGACPGDGMWGYVGGSGMLMVNWVDPTFGTITTTSNLASASWTITGPATIIGSGISQTSISQPTGTYTITWNPVAGYTTPGTQTLTLVSGGSVAFNGNYTASVVVSPPHRHHHRPILQYPRRQQHLLSFHIMVYFKRSKS